MTSQRETLNALAISKFKNNKLFVSKRFFRIDRSLGSGATSTVLRGSYNKGGELLKRKVAIKLFHDEYVCSKVSRDMLANEISILTALNHPNIIRLHEILLRRTISGETLIRGLVFDYCDMGDLYGYLSISTGFRLSEDFIRAIFQQLVRAIAYLHSQNVVHNDIKPENILLKSNGVVLLTDFGFAQRGRIFHQEDAEKHSTASSETAVSVNEKSRSNTSLERVLLHKSLNKSVSNFKLAEETSSRILRSKSHTGISSMRKQLRVTSNCGTPEYRAPEALLGSCTSEFDGAAADVFGLGIVLFVMIFGRFPAKGERPNPKRERERRMLFGNSCTDTWGHSYESLSSGNIGPERECISEAQVVCNHLMQQNPLDRPKSVDLLYHHYVQANKGIGSTRVVRKELKRLKYYRK